MSSGAEWLGAGATGGALLIAAVALWRQVNDKRDERDDRAHERAKGVGFKVGAGGQSGPDGFWDVEMVWTNATDYFAYDLAAHLTYASGDPMLPADEVIVDIGPGESATRVVRIGYFEPWDVRWTMSWRDHLGGRWVRTHRGEVRRA